MSGAAEAANHHRAGHEATNEGHRSCASFPSFRFLSSSPVDLRGRRSRKAPSSSEVDRLVDRRRAHQREERGPRLDSSLLGKKTFYDEEGRGVAVRLRRPATPCDEPRPRPPGTGVPGHTSSPKKQIDIPRRRIYVKCVRYCLYRHAADGINPRRSVDSQSTCFARFTTVRLEAGKRFRSSTMLLTRRVDTSSPCLARNWRRSSPPTCGSASKRNRPVRP